MSEEDYNKIFKCKFSVDVGHTRLRYVCGLATSVGCDGLSSDRIECPYWATVYHRNKVID